MPKGKCVAVFCITTNGIDSIGKWYMSVEHLMKSFNLSHHQLGIGRLNDSCTNNILLFVLSKKSCLSFTYLILAFQIYSDGYQSQKLMQRK